MGIALPEELTDVAARVGVQWPQADEAAMRTAARAWRDAATKLTTLARDADSAAGEALGAMTGQAADAAKRYWDRFVHAENGHFISAVTGCRAAADRLDRAADKIGAAKVEITRKLTALARSRDTGGALADTHPGALGALGTLLAGAKAEISGILGDLTDSVNLNGQSVLPADGQLPVMADGAGGNGMPSGGLLGLASGLPSTDGLLPKPADGTSPQGFADTDGKASQVVDPKTGLPIGPALPGATEHGDAGLPGSDLPRPGPPTDNSGDPTGRVSQHVIAASDGGASSSQSTGPVPSHSYYTDPLTGPIPVQHAPGYADPNPPTGPIALPPPAHLQQGTSLQTAAPSVLPPPAATTPVPPLVDYQPPSPQQVGSGGGFWGGSQHDMSTPVQPGAPVTAPPGGASVARVQPGMPTAQPPGAQFGGAQPGAVVGAGQPGIAQPGIVQPGGGRLDQGVADARRAPQGTGAQPGVGVSPDQQQQSKPVPVRQVRQVLRPEDTPALFLAYMFPIGHMPVPASRPACQLSVPPAEVDYAAGLRFPPHDHPDSALLLEVEVAGSPIRIELPEPSPADAPEVVTLAEKYDPLGGGHERDWDHRFLVREGADGSGTEYSWPPGELFPEGGCARGEAAVLGHGTVIDRFGSAEGRVFAPDGTLFARRSLPPEQLAAGYQRYRVLGRLPVWQTISAPWFGQPGGGVRYRTVYPAADLVALGYLEVVA